jgi:uncharacterized membrane protein YdbT with pleckstrin-like domain
MVLRISRLPSEPHAPEGAAGSVQVFRAGRNFLRWSIIVWFFSHFGLLLLTVVLLVALENVLLRMPGWMQAAIRAGEVLGLAAQAFIMVYTWCQIKLNYELRWYIVTDRSLRIRSGIFNVKELTMTFANIQEVRVSSNPLQLFLGLADVEVRTAGGGAAPHGLGGSHVGRFEGVDNAEAIRDLLVDRLKTYRDSGLGGAVETAVQAPQDGALQAAGELLAEARALHATLQRG